MKEVAAPFSRVTRWVLAAALVALAARVVVALAYPPFVSGDALWYTRIAKTILAEGVLGPDLEKFDRPPLYPLFLAGAIRVFGDHAEAAVRLVNAVAMSSMVLSSAWIARQVAPDRPRIAVVVAWLVALDPWSTEFTGNLYTENLLNPALMAWIGLALASRDALSTGRVLLLGAGGAFILHTRMDVLPVLVAVPAVLAWRWLGGSRAATKTWPRWALATAVSLVLCIPWSALATARRGETIFVASRTNCIGARENHGWFRFMSTVMLRREQWLGITWWESTRCPQEWVPSSIFVSPDEEAEVRDIMRRSAAARAPLGEERLDALAEERIRAHPLAYFVVHPLIRSASMWLDPTDSDRPIAIRHQSRSVVGAIHAAAGHLWSVLRAIGFLLAWYAIGRTRGPTLLLGAIVLIRTYSILLAGLVTTGQALFERRYMTCVEPLALILAVWGAFELASRLRRRTSGPAASG